VTPGQFKIVSPVDDSMIGGLVNCQSRTLYRHEHREAMCTDRHYQ